MFEAHKEVMFTTPATSTLFPPLIGNVYHIRKRSRRESSQGGGGGGGGCWPSIQPGCDTVQSLTTDMKTFSAGFNGFHKPGVKICFQL